MFAACSKSTIVGSEILSDDFVDVHYTDTFKIKTLNVDGDSARIYPASNSLFLLGSVDDPVFGKSTTEAYTQLRRLFDISELENISLDSVVLSMGINTYAFWGDTMADQSIEIYELNESLIDYDSIYSTQQFEKGMYLGGKTYNPYLVDTAAVIFRGDTFYYPNICRIQLDQSFGEKLLGDTLALQSDTLIQELTNGLVIKSTSSTSSVFGVSNSIYLDDYTNKVILYYTQDDTVSYSYALTLGGKRGLYIENNRSGTLLEDYIGNEPGSDSLLFLTGMLNSNVEVQIPDLDYLNDEDKMINYAELEFYINKSVWNSPYELVDQIYAYNVSQDGDISYVYDLSISLLQSVTTYFDGTIEEVELEDGSSVMKYNINLTNEIKKRIRENDMGTLISLAPYLSADRAYRSVLYGPGSSVYPAKLKITYTQQ